MKYQVTMHAMKEVDDWDEEMVPLARSDSSTSGRRP